MPTPPPPTDPWLWDSSPVPPTRPAIRVRVYRLRDSETTPVYLPNLECVRYTRALGADPGHAAFRYVFNGRDSTAPQSVEQALSTAISLARTVNPGDELIVVANRPNTDVPRILFFGTALNFGMRLGHHTEDVHIIATGYARLAWNAPIGGLYLRDATKITDGKDFQTDLPAQFNPKGEPNATPPEAYVNASDDPGIDWKHPTFLDHRIVRTPDVRKKWTLAMAVRYLVYRHMDTTPETKFRYPTGDEIDELFVALEPIDGTPLDPADSSTYTTRPIIVSDRPISGRDWPTVLNEMIRDKGFWMRWAPFNNLAGGEEDGTIKPGMALEFGRIQGSAAPTDLYLAARGSTFDPETSNVAEANVQRDTNQTINVWTVVGAPLRYEASFLLAPGFPMVAGDSGSLAALATFDRNSPAFDADSDKYRLWVYDETGEGHYGPGTSTAVDPPAPGDFTPVLGDLADSGESDPTHQRRRRPGIGELISKDDGGKPRRYSLAISRDSTQDAPGVWDGTGHWQEIEGGFQLLKDRLGVRITVDNPNAWNIGKSTQPNAPYPNGVLQAVQAMATAGAKNFKLRLTCCIEGDQALSAKAGRTAQSPLPEDIERVIDARDRYRKLTVHSSSPWNSDGTGSTNVIDRDDAEDAKAEAIAARAATEAGILQGTIVIPRLTDFYRPGDRIRQIAGRDLGFRTDGGSIGSTPIYPVVTSVHCELKDGQSTTLHISDQDGHRHKVEPKIRRS